MVGWPGHCAVGGRPAQCESTPAFGGAGALLSQCVKDVRLIAFEDAGPEAMFCFEVEDFPAVVINDVLGNDFYDQVAGKDISG